MYLINRHRVNCEESQSGAIKNDGTLEQADRKDGKVEMLRVRHSRWGMAFHKNEIAHLENNDSLWSIE